MKRLAFIFGLGIITAVAGGVIVSKSLSDPKTVAMPNTQKLQSGTLLSPSKSVTDFSLIDTQGKPFSQASLLGQWSLLFFGYADCPEICPKTLATIQGFWPALVTQTEHSHQTIRFIFISLDPKSDTSQKLQTFLSNFNPQFLGLTGEESEIERLSKQCSIYSWQDPNSNAHGQKIIDHTASLLLINPKGQMQAIFTPPFDTQAILNDMKTIIH